MNANEARGVVGLIGMLWPREALTPEQEGMWALNLADLDKDQTVWALHHLAKTQKWRPSLSEIVSEAKQEAAPETALEAFQAVRKAMAYPRAERADRLSAKALQAVQRIGGWSYVGTWEQSQMHHHQRLFCEAYGDVEARHKDCERLGIEPPGVLPAKQLSAAVQRALGGKGGKRHLEALPSPAPEPVNADAPEPDEAERKRVASQAADFLARLRGK